MEFNAYDFQPPLRGHTDPRYAAMTLRYDDGGTSLRGGSCFISGEVLNRVFSQPYFEAARMYFTFEGRLMLVPDYES